MSVVETGTEVAEHRGTSEGAEPTGPTDRRPTGSGDAEVGSEMETNDVHQLLEQMARMRELLSKKEAELAEVRSEVTFAQSKVETAREEANMATGEAERAKAEVELAQTEAESARRGAEVVQEELDGVNEHLATLQREQEVTRTATEVQRD